MKHRIEWKAGCSGFNYRDWKPIFYPEQLPTKNWLSFYASQFNTVEANSTFYHTPRPATLEGWYQQTPDDFVFSVKAPRHITHYKKMKDTEQLVNDFYELVMNGLQHKLGAILFQFPPNFTYSTERLEAIATQLHPAFENVVEFRHRSWWNDEVYDVLRASGIGFCGISHPSLPDDIIPGFPVQYFRFHGAPSLYRSSYSEAYLNKIFDRLNTLTDVDKVYIYFNNTIAATAIPNLRYVLGRIAAAS